MYRATPHAAARNPRATLNLGSRRVALDLVGGPWCPGGSPFRQGICSSALGRTERASRPKRYLFGCRCCSLQGQCGGHGWPGKISWGKCAMVDFCP